MNTPCMSCGQNVQEAAPEGCLHKTNHRPLARVKHGERTVVVPDHGLGRMMLGYMVASVYHPNSPFMMKGGEEQPWPQSEETNEVVITTFSGLKYKVTVELIK